MHRTESDNNVEIGGIKQYADGPPGTTVNAADKNTIQEEIAYVIEQAGLTLKTVSTETNEQLKAAIDAIILANSPNSPKVDFESLNLIINVQSNTTCDADADRLSLLNSSNVPAYIDSLNTTFDITTDLMAGTAEKASTWYQLWIDSGGTRLMVPDIESTTDGVTASKLEDSTQDFITDKVSVGDIVYNLTDLTQATVTAIDDLDTLSLSADIMANGEDYKIRMLSPTGLGTAFKARIGAAYNNSGSNLDDSTYTQIQDRKSYLGDTAGLKDFVLTSTPAVTGINRAKIDVYQTVDWTGLGAWYIILDLSYSVANVVRTGCVPSTTGIVYKNAAGLRQSVIAQPTENGIVGWRFFATINASTITFDHTSAPTTGYHFFGNLEQEKKPTFHN